MVENKFQKVKRRIEMIKKKACKKATKRGKWAMEYKVKVSVKPIKRKKKGSWATLSGTGKCKKCSQRGVAGAYPSTHYYCRTADKPIGSINHPISNLKKCPKKKKK
jgi:hypothetical protein